MMKGMFIQDWWTGLVVTVELALIGFGVLISAVNGSLIGLALMVIGIILIAYGWRQIPAEPYTVGVLTKWGQMITEGDEKHTTAVKGIVILLPPFLDIIEIDMTNEEWVFTKEVLSVEAKNDRDGKPLRVPLKGTISLTVQPEPTDLFDYVQSGKKNQIKGQIDGIVFREVQKIIAGIGPGTEKVYDPEDGHLGLGAISISQRGQLISDKLQELVDGRDELLPNGDPHHHEGILEQRSFGMKCIKVQVDFPIPDDVRQTMIDSMSIVYETSARQTEYEGDIAAANKFKTELGLDGDAAWKALRQSRLTRDGMMSESLLTIEGKGTTVGGAIVINNPNLAMGGGNQPKKGKGGGD